MKTVAKRKHSRSVAPLLIALTMSTLSWQGPAAANAREPENFIQVVQIGDLDIRSTGGQLELRKRVQVAAARVCMNATDGDSVYLRTFQNCKRDVIKRALSQVDLPLLQP